MYNPWKDWLRAKEGELAQQVLDEAREVVKKPRPRMKVARMVSNILEESDLQGRVRQKVADRLPISTETLRCHLSCENTTFGKLLDRERKRRAELAISHGEKSQEELLRATGYANASGLSRSWPKWYGCAFSEDARLKKTHGDTYRGLWD